MPVADRCLDAEQVRALVHDQLPLEEMGTALEHLERCSHCADLLQCHAGDNTPLPRAVAIDTLTEGPEASVIKELIARLANLDGWKVASSSASEATLAGVPSDENSFPFLSPPQAPDEMGRLGRYRVLRVLGSGGMGVVFLAEDIQLRRPVALKVMRPELSASRDYRERFLREARSAATIEHDHIVTVYHADEDGGVPMLAMQMLQGETLEDRLKREGKLPPAEAARIGREIAEALHAAHGRGLIHRDIKPANVWLEGERRRVKVLDFGLARLLQGEGQLTQEGAILGTPAYMAPEQAEGGTIDARADLFSLGAVLYRMVTGEPPFRGAHPMAILRSLTNDTPPPAHKVVPAVPPALSKLIQRLLSKPVADRPASAAQVVRELARIEAIPSTRTEHASRTTSRRRWLVAASLAAAILGGAVLAGMKFAKGEGTLAVKVSVPDVKVVIDGKQEKAVGPEELWKVSLSSGKHRLAATRGKDEFECTFTVKAGKTIEIVVPFTPDLPPLDEADPFKGLRYEDIPAAERFEWQPRELIGVLGSSRFRSFRQGSDLDGPPRLSFGDGGKQMRFTFLTGGDTVRVNDAETGRQISGFHRPRRQPVIENVGPINVLSEDGEFAAQFSGTRGDWTWSVREAATGKLRTALRSNGIPLSWLTFSAGARLIAGVGMDGTVFVFDGTTGRRIAADLKLSVKHSYRPLCSPDGKLLALWRFDGKTGADVAVYDTTTWKHKASFKTLSRSIDGPMAISPDGRWLTCGGNARKVWDLATGKERPDLFGAGESSVVWNQVAFSPDSKLMAYSVGDKIKLYDLEAGKELQMLPGTGYFGMAFSPDGKRFASMDHLTIRLWDVESGKQLNKTQDSYLLAAASADGSTLAAFSSHGKTITGHVDRRHLHLFNLPRCKAGPVLKVGLGYMFHRVAFSPDGKRVATDVGHGSGRAFNSIGAHTRLWDLGNKDPNDYDYIRLSYPPRMAFLSRSPLAFARDGKTVLSAAWPQDSAPQGGAVLSWAAPNGKETRGLELPAKETEVLAFSADGRTVARSAGKKVWIQDAASGKVRKTYTSSFDVDRLALSGDEKRLAVAAGAHLEVVDAEAGKLLFKGKSTAYCFTSLGFGPDDRTAITTDRDGKVIQWRSGTDQTTWQLPWWIYDGALVRDGRYLITSNANGTIYVFRLAPPPAPRRTK